MSKRYKGVQARITDLIRILSAFEEDFDYPIYIMDNGVLVELPRNDIKGYVVLHDDKVVISCPKE